MHAELASTVGFDLRGVVAHVVDQPQRVIAADMPREHLAYPMRDQLAIAEREVCRRAHRAEVAPALGRRQRDARELAIGEIDPVARVGLVHRAQVIAAHLVAQPARAASNLTPQLISKPMPPGEITPSGSAVAATPPTGNPYPSCMSGMP
jgi:hypothetical protein